ncbi:uncharacterized protein LTR77_001768 [Saxophila tyrrhenica]|uniref:Uncharacterized protein n=1 Tax=Saxophila tyrrhenica TaxID=1690608 RepID=A0AAV9PPI4_9PEZI|nr:hypothetical protein LTR77_001768 [Saxophila tyrrhenica]
MDYIPRRVDTSRHFRWHKHTLPARHAVNHLQHSHPTNRNTPQDLQQNTRPRQHQHVVRLLPSSAELFNITGISLENFDTTVTAADLAFLAEIDAAAVEYAQGKFVLPGRTGLANLDELIAGFVRNGPDSEEGRKVCNFLGLEYLIDPPPKPAGLEKLIKGTCTLQGQDWKRFTLYTDPNEPGPDSGTNRPTITRRHDTVIKFFVLVCERWYNMAARATQAGYQLDHAVMEANWLPIMADLVAYGEIADGSELDMVYSESERPGVTALFAGMVDEGRTNVESKGVNDEGAIEDKIAARRLEAMDLD